MPKPVAPWEFRQGSRGRNGREEILVKQRLLTYSALSAFSIPAIARAQRLR